METRKNIIDTRKVAWTTPRGTTVEIVVALYSEQWRDNDLLDWSDRYNGIVEIDCVAGTYNGQQLRDVGISKLYGNAECVATCGNIGGQMLPLRRDRYDQIVAAMDCLKQCAVWAASEARKAANIAAEESYQADVARRDRIERTSKSY